MEKDENHFIPFRKNVNELANAIEKIAGNESFKYGKYTKSVEVLKLDEPILTNPMLTILDTDTIIVKTYCTYFQKYCQIQYGRLISRKPTDIKYDFKNYLILARNYDVTLYQTIFCDAFTANKAFFSTYAHLQFNTKNDDFSNAKNGFMHMALLLQNFFIFDKVENNFAQENVLKISNSDVPVPLAGEEYFLYIYKGISFYKRTIKFH